MFETYNQKLAREFAEEAIPYDYMVIVVKRDGTVYIDGEQYYGGIYTDHEDDCECELAYLGPGKYADTLVAIKEPLPDEEYRWNEDFNPDTIDEARDELRENKLHELQEAEYRQYYPQFYPDEMAKINAEAEEILAAMDAAQAEYVHPVERDPAGEFERQPGQSVNDYLRKRIRG